MSVFTCETAEAAARALAACVRDAAVRLTEERGRFTLALAGGSTPRRVHELLAEDPGFDWTKVEVFFGDERCVPPDHEASNFRMARETLLDRVPIREEAIHRIRGELPPEDAAARYSEEMVRVLGRPPRLDLVLLGVGTDGHTASLFPGTPGLEAEERVAVATESPVEPVHRVSLSLRTLREARNVAFLATGAAKRDVVRRILEEGPSAERPASLVRPSDWFLDREAAE
jgi:6-phosphogluconolactonase